MSGEVTVFHGTLDRLFAHYVSRGQAILLHAYLLGRPTANLTTSYRESKAHTTIPGHILEFKIPRTQLTEVDVINNHKVDGSSWFVSSTNLPRDEWQKSIPLTFLSTLKSLIGPLSDDQLSDPSSLPEELIISYIESTYFVAHHQLNSLADLLY